MTKHTAPERGPGQGRMRTVPSSITARCRLCSEVIVSVLAVHSNLGWEHERGSDGRPTCWRYAFDEQTDEPD